MIVNTRLFKKGVKFLSFVNNTQLFEGAVSLYTHEGDLFGECLEDGAAIGVSVILSRRVEGEISAIVSIKQLKALVHNFAGETFDLSVEGEVLKISTDIRGTLKTFSTKSSYPKIEESFEKGELVGKKEGILDKEKIEILSAYVEYISRPEDGYNFIFVKDKIVVTNLLCVRSAKCNLGFPYTIHFGSSLVRLVKELENPSISCYENCFIIEDIGRKVYVARDFSVESIYNNILSQEIDTNKETSFTIDTSKYRSVLDRLRGFMGESNTIVLDLKNNKILLENEDANLVYDYDFSTSGEFSKKTINGFLFYNFLKFCDIKVQIYSDPDPDGFFCWENDKEFLLMTTLKSY